MLLRLVPAHDSPIIFVDVTVSILYLQHNTSEKSELNVACLVQSVQSKESLICLLVLIQRLHHHRDHLCKQRSEIQVIYQTELQLSVFPNKFERTFGIKELCFLDEV